jgi:hypothetical protein
MSAFRGGSLLRERLFCVFALSSLCLTSAAGAAEAVPSLKIFGTPTTTVEAGEPYNFRFGAVAIGTGVVRYTIENKPLWATFDATAGRLYGNPVERDAGTWPNVRISATSGALRAALPAFSIRVRCESESGSVSLSWLPPLANEDGSALTDLVGYRLYTGRTTDSLKLAAVIRNAGVTRHLIERLQPGTHFFALTAFNASGAESDLSPVARALVP